MKPQPYLTAEGKKIFKEIVDFITLYDIEEIDSYEISQLADAIDLNARACNNINFPDDPKQKDGVQNTNNGYTQVTGHVTVRDKTQKIIDTLGDKFGLNPKSRTQIKAFAMKPNKSKSGSKKIKEFLTKAS